MEQEQADIMHATVRHFQQQPRTFDCASRLGRVRVTHAVCSSFDALLLVYEAAKSKAGSSVSAEEKNAEDAKAKLDRYQFYFDRTMEYNRSIAAAIRSLPETESRMETLQNILNSTLADVEFLANANKTVIECRSVEEGTTGDKER